jgi:DNA-binding CsgD family transcriptional regulator
MSSMLCKINVAILFLLTAFSAQCNDDRKVEFQLSYYPSNHISIVDVVNVQFSKMPESNSFGYKNGEYWFKLNIIESNLTESVVAYLPTHSIDSLELYVQQGGKLEYVSLTGNLVAKQYLAINYKYPAFKIENKDLGKTYYLKVKFPKGANFPLTIIGEDDFKDHTVNAIIYSSFFYGISLVVLLLHLFYYLKFKNSYYLFYLGFLFTLILNLLLFDGTLSHFLRPFVNQGNVELVFHIIEEFCLLGFSIHFLGLKQRMPALVKKAYGFPVLLALVYLCSIILDDFRIVAIADAVGISTMMLLWLLGVYYWKKDAYAKFYVLGYLILMPLGMYYFIGYDFGFWPVTGDDTIVKIGSSIDMLVFTYAIIFRMKAENDHNSERVTELKKMVEDVKLESQVHRQNQNQYLQFLVSNMYCNSPLTTKEVEILECIDSGLTNTEIAEKMFISSSTVKTHNGHILSKFKVNNLQELRLLLTKIL